MKPPHWPVGRYDVILADPPWTFATRSNKGKGRSPEQHYSCMTLDDIKALPVPDLAAKDCALLLWVTDPLFDVGLDVIKAWGFTYKTIGYHWVKLNKDGSPFTGMGYYTRANPELCLLATRGSPKRKDRGVPRLILTEEDWSEEDRIIMSPRREHSRKPDEAYERTERLLGGTYCELFARQQRPGWTCWGDQVDRFPSLDPSIDDLLDDLLCDGVTHTAVPPVENVLDDLL